MSEVKPFKYEEKEFTIRETEDCGFVVTDELGAEAIISVVPNARPGDGTVPVWYSVSGNSRSSLSAAREFAAKWLIESRVKPLTQKEACEIARKEFDELTV